MYAREGTDMIFFIDSNVFIESRKNFYAPDICSAFWLWFSEECSKNSNIRSITNVLEELDAGRDDLPEWVRQKLPRDFFMSVSNDADIIAERRRMQDVLEERNDYKSAKVRNFLAKADLWLIAAAKVKGGCVVTNERANPEQARIKIPSVANQFGVNCCEIYDVMRTLGVRLNLYDRLSERPELVFEGGRVVKSKLPSLLDCAI